MGGFFKAGYYNLPEAPKDSTTDMRLNINSSSYSVL